MYCVYRVIGPTGVYVGYTSDLERRRREHFKNAGKDPTHFHRALAKYTAEAFAWEVVLVVRNSVDAAECERVIIAQERQAGTRLYNETLGGDGAPGYRHTEATRGRMRETRARQEITPRALAALLRFAKGPRNEQHRARIGAANKGKVRTAETRLKLSLAAQARVARERDARRAA